MPEEKVNVLLVDDQPDNLMVMETVLEGLGENLVKARSGTEALRRLLDDDYAVILLDVQMPGMDGFETASLIRARDRSRLTPIIFVTAFNKGENYVSRGYSLGAVDYIFKPIVPDVLKSKVAVFAELFRKSRQIQRLNESLRQRTLDLEAANRDLESFSYSVSHDLRAPLRAISGFSQILSRRHRAALDEEGRHYVDNIVEAGERMGQLIDDLLAYSRLGRQAISLRPISPGQIIDRILEGMAPAISAAGAKVTAEGTFPAVIGDATLLTQVLSNLIQNAITYSRPGVPPEVEVSCVAEIGSLTIQVRDNGIGIAPEHQSKVFQMFQRLHGDDEYPGTGIGLAIVAKSMALMDGRVSVESAPGEGSTFSIVLPRAK